MPDGASCSDSSSGLNESTLDHVDIKVIENDLLEDIVSATSRVFFSPCQIVFDAILSNATRLICRRSDDDHHGSWARIVGEIESDSRFAFGELCTLSSPCRSMSVDYVVPITAGSNGTILDEILLHAEYFDDDVSMTSVNISITIIDTQPSSEHNNSGSGGDGGSSHIDPNIISKSGGSSVHPFGMILMLLVPILARR